MRKGTGTYAFFVVNLILIAAMLAALIIQIRTGDARFAEIVRPVGLAVESVLLVVSIIQSKRQQARVGDSGILIRMVTVSMFVFSLLRQVQRNRLIDILERIQSTGS